MYAIDIYYGNKIVGQENLKATCYMHACKLADYIAKTVAKDSIPPWAFNAQRVSWSVFKSK